jgi:hypothetical protein
VAWAWYAGTVNGDRRLNTSVIESDTRDDDYISRTDNTVLLSRSNNQRHSLIETHTILVSSIKLIVRLRNHSPTYLTYVTELIQKTGIKIVLSTSATAEL